MIGREYTEIGRAQWARPVTAYSRHSLNAACEARHFEEFQIPLGTDRITNDLLRLQYRLRQLEDDHDSRIETLERDTTEHGNAISELESQIADVAHAD